MAPAEFHAALNTLGLAQRRVAALFGVGARSVRRWQYGERRVPHGVRILVRLMADGVLSVEQVEQAAVRRTNGGPELSGEDANAPDDALEPKINGAILVEDDLHELPADAVTEATGPNEPVGLLEVTAKDCVDATFDDPALEPGPSAPEPVSTAEKLAALTASVCHWPCGDPRQSDFRFCGEATTNPPYCETHRGAAYMALPPQPVRRRHRRRYASARIAWAG
jgi:hypothetical protein